MSTSALYLIVALLSLLLFNSLLLVARFARQIKQAPPDDEIDRMIEERKRLEGSVEVQNLEIVDLQLKLKNAEDKLTALQNSPSPSASA